MVPWELDGLSLQSQLKWYIAMLVEVFSRLRGRVIYGLVGKVVLVHDWHNAG